MLYAAFQPPAGNINCDCVGVVELDVFFILVAGWRVEHDSSKIDGYAVRLGIGDAGILVVSGIVDTVIDKQVITPHRQIGRFDQVHVIVEGAAADQIDKGGVGIKLGRQFVDSFFKLKFARRGAGRLKQGIHQSSQPAQVHLASYGIVVKGVDKTIPLVIDLLVLGTSIEWMTG